MTYPEAVTSSERLRDSIRKYMKVDRSTAAIAREQKLGEMHMGDAVPWVARADALVTMVEGASSAQADNAAAPSEGDRTSTALISLGGTIALATAVDNVRVALEAVLGFSPARVSNQVPEVLRTNILKNLESVVDELGIIALRHVGVRLLLEAGGTAERLGAISSARDKLGEQAAAGAKAAEATRVAQGEVEAARDAALDAQKKASEILTAMQLDAGKLGVEEHAISFDALAAEHKTLATRWLIACTVLLVALLGVGAVLTWYWHPGEKLSEIAQGIAIRVVLVGAVYYGLVVAVRNYRAHRHLAVINAHRRTALKTFSTFAKAATDDATKNAVLLEATRAIFTAGTTGYLPGPGEDDNPSRVVEILRLASGKAPPGPGGA